MQFKTGKLLMTLSALVAVIVSVGFLSPLKSVAAPARVLQPAITLWPLPAYGSGQKYWWSYEWINGASTTCSNSNPKTVVYGAEYLHDYAFGDTPSTPTNLLSIQVFKSDPCTYWNPGQDKILRWYAKGNTPIAGSPQTAINDISEASNASSKFLSFRGYSSWITDRTGSTKFFYPSNPTPRVQVNGRYNPTDTTGVTFAGGSRFSYQQGDNYQVPNYLTLPDRMLNANIDLTRGAQVPSNIASDPQYNDYTTNTTGWTAIRNGATSGTGTSTSQRRWTMWSRKTNLYYGANAKPVLYVGYSETTDTSTGTGACEETWYAQDVGPIYVSKYPNVTTATCYSYLAVATSGSGVDNPESFFAYNPHLQGWLRLSDLCIQAGCNIQYQ